MRKLLPLLLLLAVPAAADPVISSAIGANVVWFNGGSGYPQDVELGGNAAASLSPHISATGSLFFGLDNSYLVGDLGALITATDVNDPDFSIGLGAAYQMSSETETRPQEWIAKAALGWRPWPQRQPRWILGLQGSRGFDSGSAALQVRARYAIGGGY